ncbi:MAG: SCO family protein [Rubrivivax sp.]|nr:SCO family protein [Rubrivivax sp.]
MRRHIATEKCTSVPRRGTSRRLALRAALLATVVLAGCSREEAGAPKPSGSFKSIDITGADYAQALELPDPDGKRRTLAEFKGKVVVLFFGFTQCPDVCPTTMAELATAKQQLGADKSRVVPVFVTVDPERDTPDVLKAYVGSFGPDFVALRGTPEETKAVAKAFKIFYAKVPGKTESSYTIDHTARSYVYDTRGRLRLATRHGMGMDALVSDLRRLLAEKG